MSIDGIVSRQVVTGVETIYGYAEDPYAVEINKVSKGGFS